MGSSIDRFLEQDPKTPRQEPTDIDRWLSRDDEVRRLRDAARRPKEPEQSARVLQLRDRTGLPAPVVERNLERLETESRTPNTDTLARESPVIAEWLAEDPRHFSVAQDDLSQLSFIDRTWQALKRGRNVGVAESLRGRLGTEAQNRRGDLDEYQTTRLQQLNAQIAEKPEGLGFLNNLVFGSAKILGQMEDAVPGALASGFAGASAGATAGAILGPGAAGTAAAGFAAGVAAGFGKYTFQVEAGNQYLEMDAVRGEDGQPLDENTKQLVASGVGFANSLFEVAGASLVARPFLSVAKRFTREAAKDALVRPTMRAAMADFGKAYAVALGGEVGTEFMQEVSGIVGDEIAKYGSDGTFEQLLTSPELREEAVLRLTNIVKETAQGMALLALPGAGIRGGTTAFDARRARKREEFYLALGTGIKDSKTFQRLPEGIRQIAARATQDGPIETVYFPVETFQTYWQSQNRDPADVAEELLGERASFEQAVATGSDLAVPMHRYATRLAPTDHNTFFAREIRARPNEMNGREAAELLGTEAATTESAQPVAEQSEDDTRIVEQLAEQLQTARPNLYDDASAKTVAETLYGRVFRRLAEQMGTTPAELYARFPLSISGPEEAAVAPITSEGHEAGGLSGIIQRGWNLFEDLREKAKFDKFEESTADVLGDRPMRGTKRAPVEGAVNPKFKLEIDDDLVSRAADVQNRISEYGTGAHGSPMWVRETDVGGMVSGGTRIKARLNADDRLLTELRTELLARGWPESELDALMDERVGERMTARQKKLLFGDAKEIEAEKALIAAERADRKKAAAEERREGRKAARAASVFNQSAIAEPRLVVLHNLSVDNLKFADEMGGLAVPSLGVVKEGGSYTGMGEITLIGKPHLGDPELVPIHDADVYSPTFPRPEYPKAKVKDAERLAGEFKEWAAKFDEPALVDEMWDNAVNRAKPQETISRLVRSQAAQAKFLFDEKEITVEPVMRPANIQAPFIETAAFKKFESDVGFDPNYSYVDTEYRTKLAKAVRAAIKEYAETAANGDAKVRRVIASSYSKQWFDEEGLVAFGVSPRIERSRAALGRMDVDFSETREVVEAALAGYEAEFKSWVDEKVLGIHGKPFLRVNRKKADFTLENIVAVMTGPIKAQQETMTYGEGKARAASATRLTTLQWMRNASYQIEGEEKVNEAREKAKKLLDEYRQAMLRYTDMDTWGALDASMKAIARWAQGRGMAEALRAEGFRGVPKDVVAQALEAGKAFRDAPVPYFEAKPQRAVTLDEFAGAVLPEESATPETRAILEKHGIAVKTYTPDDTVGEGEASRAAAVAELQQELGPTVLFQKDKESPRGRIVIGGSSIEIQLLENADLSTFIHETGHFYAEILSKLAADPDATDLVRADWAVLRDWAGAAEGEQLTTEHHEKIARGFEAYLMQGKAPSIELRAVFARMRAWLIRVYRSLESLDVELTPEVRNVFDRLLASEDEIAQAEREQGMGGVAEAMRAVGIPEGTVQKIAEAEAEARTAAEEYLSAKMIADVEREQSEVYKAERAAILEDVAEMVNNERDSMALAFLMRGTLPDGSPLPPEIEPFKLSKAGLTDYEGRYPGLMARLRRFFVYAKEGGQDPDVAAEVLGYGSGDELIQALLAAEESPRARIERLVDERMRESDLNLVTPAELPVEAMKAVHNEKRTQLHRKVLEVLASNDLPTLKTLVRRISRRIAPVEEVKAEAERIVATKKVRELSPLIYQRAEVKAAKAATEALLRGDIEMAFEEKQRESLNHELYRAATTAKEEADGFADYMKGLNKPAPRERLGKAGGDYLDQVDGFLDRFDFARVTVKALDRRRDLREWYDEQVEGGFSPVISPKLLNEAYRTNYKDMTVGELRDVRSAVQSIVHLARLKNKLLANKRARDFAEVRQEIVSGIAATHKIDAEPENLVPSLGKDIKKGAEGWVAEHTRMEFLFDFLDGYVGLGPVWRALFKPFADAEVAENEMRRRDAEAMKAIWAPYVAGKDELEASLAQRALFTKRIYIPEAKTRKMDGNFTKAQLFVVALNWGNAYNRDALMEGWGWDEAQVTRILDQLDERDWKTVQAIWDHIESYWPEIEALEKELNGVAPAKVQSTSVKTKFGELRGGYYPIMFDRERSTRQRSLDEGATLKESLGGNYFRAMTAHGHAKERQGTGGKPLLLELSALAQHLGQVTHDLSHRRAVIDVWRLIHDDEIRSAVEVAAGRDMADQLKPWIHAIAGDRSKLPANKVERMLGRVRAGATVVGLGLRVTSSVLQTLGFTMTAKEIGTKYAMRGVGDAFGRPHQIKKQWEFVTSRSQMMRDRLMNYDRDVRDYVRRLPVGNLGEQDAAWFIFIGYMDRAVSFPSWLGAYRKAMDGAVGGIEKGAELEAIDYADKIVRTTQAAGAAKDLAAIQRGGEAWRIWTMFYSSMSIYFGQFDKTRREFQITKNVPRLVASLALVWFLPSVVEDLIRGEGPDEDEGESWFAWLFNPRRLVFPLETVVGLRDIVSAAEWSLKTGRKDFSGSPVLRAGESAVGSIMLAARVLDPEQDVTRSNVRDLVETVGYVTKLPSGQVWRTGEYLHDWMISGDEEPESVLQGAYHALITGKPRD